MILANFSFVISHLKIYPAVHLNTSYNIYLNKYNIPSSSFPALKDFN